MQKNNTKVNWEVLDGNVRTGWSVPFMHQAAVGGVEEHVK
jgi:hypothetical protein